jgi:hypothetical protein
MPQVSYPEHNTEATVEWSYHQGIAKDDAGRRPRESDKNETGNDRDPDHAEKDFDGNDNMAVNRRRIIVAVADGSKCLDTEEEGLGKRARCHVGNTVSTEGVESSEEKVDEDVTPDKEEGETRPA